MNRKFNLLNQLRTCCVCSLVSPLSTSFYLHVFKYLWHISCMHVSWHISSTYALCKISWHISCVYVSWHNSSTYMQVSWHISCMYVSWHISSMLRKHMCAGICHISYMQASIWYISCTWQIFLYISKCLGKQSTLEEPFKSTVSMTAYWIYAGMA